MLDAIKIAFAECPELPFLPELPERGPHAALIGRGTAFLSGLGVELHANGWRLTDNSGRDHRRALATLRSDLDLLEEVAQGYVGPVKIAAAGPWTLAASLEHPRGDKVIADPGARRELGQSLAEGLAIMTGELAAPTARPRRDHAARRALAAGGPGWHRTDGERPGPAPQHRHPRSERLAERDRGASEDLRRRDLGALLRRRRPDRSLRGAGVAAVLVDLDQLVAADWDAIGSALEAGLVPRTGCGADRSACRPPIRWRTGSCGRSGRSIWRPTSRPGR